ncbi:MAG TPA: hypothetical protein VFH39_01750 [Candidatus Saccharimonadales bacterium]|nr:hypothetical protein [Candidatus Saccharimonadales bacterium]
MSKANGFVTNSDGQDKLRVVVSGQTGGFIDDLIPTVKSHSMAEVVRRSLMTFLGLVESNPNYRNLIEHPVPAHANATRNVSLQFKVSDDFRHVFEQLEKSEHLTARQLVEYAVRWLWLSNRFMQRGG